MTATACALLGFASWTIFLLLLLAIYRTSAVMTGKKKANAFSPLGDDVSGYPQRLTRAHANCYENLPIAGVILLYAIATSQTAITDGLAYYFLGARILQSLTHLASTSANAVTVRFAFFVVQVAIEIYWLLALFHVI
ncbi:MAG: MAPEG family protein [Alphaproteobacteria bacterium]|nr:MAPEG family protein [Alphaproteobacteria bacterium]